MSEGTHRCSVEGCPNLAAHEVMLYDFDPAEGAVRFAQDASCPFICVEHAIDNERQSHGTRQPHSVVRYPYTNREQLPGMSIYLQLEPAYAACQGGEENDCRPADPLCRRRVGVRRRVLQDARRASKATIGARADAGSAQPLMPADPGLANLTA